MPNRTLGAGSGPEVLAKARRRRATILKVLAFSILAVLFPIALFCNFVPLWAYVLLLIAARLCYVYSGDFLQLARRADRGGQAERDVVKMLGALPEGWRVEAGIYFEGFGDIDIFVTSPAAKAFVIDVKSHKGEVTVTSDESRLVRIVDGTQSEFEKDILKGVRAQVSRLCRERNILHVIPVLVFTRAKLRFPKREIDKVFVVEQKQLLSFLIEFDAQEHSRS